MKVICTMFNYFKKETAKVVYWNGYRFMVGNYISKAYETEREVIRELVKREYYLN